MDSVSLILSATNIFTALLVIALCVPMWLEWVPPNRFYGARFQASYSSDENWYRINRYCGRLMTVWSLPVLFSGVACLFFALEHRPALTMLFALAPIVVLVPAIQTYTYGRRLVS